MFSRFKNGVASPDAQLAVGEVKLPDPVTQLYQDVERVAYWFLRNFSVAIPADQRHDLLPHFRHYLGWCYRMVDMVSRSEQPKVPAVSNYDTRQCVDAILTRYESRKDVRFVQVIAYRYPGLNVLEVGAGTRATTIPALRELGDACASYTFTEISSGFFIAAEELFEKEAGSMVFKTFDMEKEPMKQGFVEGSYEVVIAVNVLHVAGDLETSLSNVRRLLKPGGFLVVGEFTYTNRLFSGMTVGTLPGWWIGAENGRPWVPLLTLG
ncbi:methyltransferase [Hirsutella rhossiliensis]|uniref:Methyltransferase domain-containing protein n=1 Tax=Hirsutella rhossiliensis TaxID=111463 RepID=A0A9P8SGH3_9HYPO|nr:methyltransferase domain-containing protein [Hirsutella rhossiliensis]KAH0961786.1 methyltransferase domain-containing protein [Hirsutella rhossiliensis]